MAGKLGWLAAFLFVACTALRLARFNTQVGVEDKSYFQGLASPAAAGMLVATVWFFNDHGVAGETVRWLIWVETVFLGLLMFSRVRYFSGKAWPSGDRIPIYVLFLLVLTLVLLAVDPPTVLLVIGVVYVSSGIIITLLRRRQWKSRRMKRILARRQEPDTAGTKKDKDEA
jgi:CDP-diacylglycerol--serine O-phosphatidyltransferase